MERTFQKVFHDIPLLFAFVDICVVIFVERTNLRMRKASRVTRQENPVFPSFCFVFDDDEKNMPGNLYFSLQSVSAICGDMILTKVCVL